jgi:cell wall-associated NlpC family hydrolase
MVRASELIKWIKSKVGCGYVYGTVGQTCTVSLLKECQSRLGTTMGNGYYQLNGDYTKGHCGRWIGKWVCDCSGLIKAARKALSSVWKDVSAQGTYDQCTRRGTIGGMPLIPGCTVYMYSASSKRMTHVGIYAGQGRVYEARGVDYGIVQTDLADRAWTHWGLLDWLQHDLPTDTGKAIVGTSADSGDASTPKADDTRPVVMTLAKAVKLIDIKLIDISEELWAGADLEAKKKYIDTLLIKIGEKLKG